MASFKNKSSKPSSYLLFCVIRFFYPSCHCGVILVFNFFVSLCPCAHAQSLVNCSPRLSHRSTGTLSFTTASIPFRSNCTLVQWLCLWFGQGFCASIWVRIQPALIFTFSTISVFFQQSLDPAVIWCTFLNLLS